MNAAVRVRKIVHREGHGDSDSPMPSRIQCLLEIENSLNHPRNRPGQPCTRHARTVPFYSRRSSNALWKAGLVE
jgi:hypothetical protein